MTNQLHYLSRLAWLCLGVFTASNSMVAASESVRVHLASGRTFEGFVDERTSDESLWLRFEGQATLLYRPISWDRVEAVQYQGRDLTADELRQLVPQIESKGDLSVPQPAEQPPRPQSDTQSDAEIAEQLLAQPTKVRSLEIDATVANWDADFNVDGIRVFVYPLDGSGQIVPVRGSVQIKLIGIRPASLPARYSYPRGVPFPTLGTWTRQVTQNEVGSSGAVVELPFTGHDPTEEFDLGAYGTVVARLMVPGSGVFEARADVVRIRPYQPIVLQ